jgi:hypothetical protein
MNTTKENEEENLQLQRGVSRGHLIGSVEEN